MNHHTSTKQFDSEVAESSVISFLGHKRKNPRSDPADTLVPLRVPRECLCPPQRPGKEAWWAPSKRAQHSHREAQWKVTGKGRQSHILGQRKCSVLGPQASWDWERGGSQNPDKFHNIPSPHYHALTSLRELHTRYHSLTYLCPLLEHEPHASHHHWLGKARYTEDIQQVFAEWTSPQLLLL